MADCTYARCQQERRAIRRELQRWTKNMVYVLGLERVAEELMGRRKWKLYQDASLPNCERSTTSGGAGGAEGEEAGVRAAERGELGADTSDEEAEMPAAEHAPPALKIKTIEQINTAREENCAQREEGTKPSEANPRTETILESLIKRPATQPRLMCGDTLDWRPSDQTCPSHRRRTLSDNIPGVGVAEEPQDWRPAERCYFCPSEAAGAATDAGGAGEGAGGGSAPARPGGGVASPAASDESGSSVCGARSPAGAAGPAPPALLAHLLQLQSHNPQAIAQFQQMMAALAALGSGLMPQAALSQAFILQRLQQNQILQHHQQVDRTAEIGEKVSLSNCSPVYGSALGAGGASGAEQPLDLSARSGSSTGEPATPPPPEAKLPSRVPPIDPKFLASVRLKRPAGAGASGGGAGESGGRRAYTDDELQHALRDIQSGRLGTRRAAVLYGIPRSTLRNKVYKLALDHPPDDRDDRDSADDDEPDFYRSLLLHAERQRAQPPSAASAPDDDNQGVILKIPTFPPPERDDTPPPPPRLLPDLPYVPLGYASPRPQAEALFSLRDVIAKSISQKFQQPPPEPAELGYRAPPDRHISVIKHLPDGQRGYAQTAPGNSRASNNGAAASQAGPGGKGTRPKRGKYRNYDRDSLVEAVKAVQRGEMSVHRAGSYYGVPHSTLEYKVKERHLMRPRKREPKQPLPESKPASSPKPPQAKAAYPNGLNGPELPGGYPPGYPFWSAGGFPPLGGSFSPAGDTFASHMMQRLREESAPPANGSTLLEGIIRSTLERPPPGSRANDYHAKANPSLLQRLSGEAGRASPPPTPLQRPTEECSPPRRPRLSSSDRQLAVEMRETVQRLRADKLRAAGSNGTPTPPHAAEPHSPTLAPAP